MQLVCPHCGKPITAENVNIQRMAAVCPSCNTIFEFDPSASKSKRRKVKQPQQITSDEADGHLNIAFRTNFRPDKSGDLLSSAGLSVAFTFITILLIAASVTKPAAALVTLGFGLFTALLYYWFALVAYNRTHIEVSDEQIKVSRKPLPNLSSHSVDLAGIERIRYEETPVSKKEGYDTPRYNVWAEVVEGNRKLIVGDVIEDYAVFISQKLNEYLNLETSPDVARLSDDEGVADEGQIADEFMARSKSSLG